MLKNKRGQALVEFAIIMPLLLMILLGIMEFAMVLSNQLILESAAREGVRYSILGATDGEVNTYISELTDILKGDPPLVVITPVGSAKPKGVPVTVTVTYQHTLMTPVIGSILGNQLQLKASTTMRME